jgi:hypothetical protein
VRFFFPGLVSCDSGTFASGLSPCTLARWVVEDVGRAGEENETRPPRRPFFLSLRGEAGRGEGERGRSLPCLASQTPVRRGYMAAIPRCGAADVDADADADRETEIEIETETGRSVGVASCWRRRGAPRRRRGGAGGRRRAPRLRRPFSTRRRGSKRGGEGGTRDDPSPLPFHLARPRCGAVQRSRPSRTGGATPARGRRRTRADG